VAYAASCGYFVTERRRVIAATAVSEPGGFDGGADRESAETHGTAVDGRSPEGRAETHGTAVDGRSSTGRAETHGTAVDGRGSEGRAETSAQHQPTRADKHMADDEHLPTTVEVDVISPPSPTATANVVDAALRHHHTPGHAPTAAHINPEPRAHTAAPSHPAHSRPASPSHAHQSRPATHLNSAHDRTSSPLPSAHDRAPSPLPSAHGRPVAHAPAAHILAIAIDTTEATNAA
jgi:hypothetical protein